MSRSHIVLESPQLPNGVTISALLKDLFKRPEAVEDSGTDRHAPASAGAVQEQQHTLHLLQRNLPALDCLQQLLAAETALGTSDQRSLHTAGSPAGHGPAELSPIKSGSAGAAALSAAQVSMAISELHHEASELL